MSYLLDTNIAIRSVVFTDPQHVVIRAAVRRLLSQGSSVVLSAQVLSETWSLMTRPDEARGGYGFTTKEAETFITELTALVPLLQEPPNLWSEHYRLLVTHKVSGIQTHDCRIAAWCRLYGIENIVTLNAIDFKRYGIATVSPSEI